jgi:hypothetical protein
MYTNHFVAAAAVVVLLDTLVEYDSVDCNPMSMLQLVEVVVDSENIHYL